jgi:hypothetical protein
LKVKLDKYIRARLKAVTAISAVLVQLSRQPQLSVDRFGPRSNRRNGETIA